jgi:hypothetical protein
MNAERASTLLCGAILIAFIAWIALHTYWTDVMVPTPARGEAAQDPYYGIERLARELNVHARQILSLRVLPPPSGILYVNNFRDDFLHNRIDSLEPWVRSGGRLVLVGAGPWSSSVLRSWTGIAPATRAKDANPSLPAFTRLPASTASPDGDCAPMSERIDGVQSGAALLVCTRYPTFAFEVKGVPTWELSNAQGLQALRMNVGRGSVTAIGPGALFDNWGIARHDHARILIAAAQLKHGDEISILNPTRGEPLLMMLWRLAAPALIFFGVAAALLILRYLPRFGPLVPLPAPARRSLGEQIRASARLAWATGKLGPLRSAENRALDEAASGRVAEYSMLGPRQRSNALASSTGLDAEALNAAMTGASEDAAHVLAEIALLERARRILKNRSAS